MFRTKGDIILYFNGRKPSPAKQFKALLLTNLTPQSRAAGYLLLQ